MTAGEPDAAADQVNEVSWAIDPRQYADRFDRVVDIVEAGADPTGEESILSTLESVVEPGTLVYFPPGEYKMTRTFRRTRSRDLGFIGNNAIIRHGRVEGIDRHTVTSGEFTGSANLFKIGIPEAPHQGTLVFGGFIFDWSSENAGMQALNCYVDGEFEVRNTQFFGIHSLGTHGNLRLVTMSPSSTGLVENVDMRWGGKHYRNTINSRVARLTPGGTGPEARQSWSTTGIAGYKDMQGTILYQNVYCGGWPDNGLYLRGGDGRKILTNCVSANSNVACIRVGGGSAWESVPQIDGDAGRESPYAHGSVVENCRVVIDHEPDETYISQRGIWCYSGSSVVRNCGVSISKPTVSGNDQAVSVNSNANSATIENTQIDLHTQGATAVTASPGAGDVSLQGLQINTPGWNGGSRVVEGPAVVENVNVNGNPIGDG